MRSQLISCSGRIGEVEFGVDRNCRTVGINTGAETGEGFLGRRILRKKVWPSEDVACLEMAGRLV